MISYVVKQISNLYFITTTSTLTTNMSSNENDIDTSLLTNAVMNELMKSVVSLVRQSQTNESAADRLRRLQCELVKTKADREAEALKATIQKHAQEIVVACESHMQLLNGEGEPNFTYESPVALPAEVIAYLRDNEKLTVTDVSSRFFGAWRYNISWALPVVDTNAADSKQPEQTEQSNETKVESVVAYDASVITDNASLLRNDNPMDVLTNVSTQLPVSAKINEMSAKIDEISAKIDQISPKTIEESNSTSDHDILEEVLSEM